MTIDEWMEHELANMKNFRDWWVKCQSEQPDRFPADLQPGDWDEQYWMFDDKPAF